MSKLRLDVELNEESKEVLRRYFQREENTEKVRCILETLICDLENEHPERAEHIRRDMDELVSIYKNDIPKWESKALNYAANHGHGVRDLLEKALEKDTKR